MPTVIFIVSILAVIVVGAFHPHPVTVIGTRVRFPVTEALGIVLLLKAFASGCLGGDRVEAISNGVPAFREPRIRIRPAHEISLGVLLG